MVGQTLSKLTCLVEDAQQALRSRRCCEAGKETLPFVPLKTSDEWCKNCQRQNGKGRCGMFPQGRNKEVWIEEVKDTAEHDAASPLARCQPWKNQRTFWQTGKTRWWQTSAKEEGNEERWKKVSELEWVVAAKRLVEAGNTQR